MILATPLVLRGLVTLLCYQDSTKNCFVRVWLKNVFASKNKNIKRTVIFPTLPKAIKVPWQLSFLRLFSLFGYFGFLFNYALSLFKIGFLFLVFLGTFWFHRRIIFCYLLAVLHHENHTSIPKLKIIYMWQWAYEIYWQFICCLT